jgi:Uma2 family endonuclease
MVRLKQAFTYQDYLALPDDRRYELLEGELCLVPSPGFFHQAVSRNLELLLWQYVKTHDLGVILHAPMDVVLSSHDVVQPDILFISKVRREVIAESCINGAPDLIIEIVSPTHRERDLLVKKSLYARYRVQEYWIVDPDNRTIEQLLHAGKVFTSHGMFSSGEMMETALLPSLILPVAQVFDPI